MTSTGNQENKLTPQNEAEIIGSGNDQFQNLSSVDDGLSSALTGTS